MAATLIAPAPETIEREISGVFPGSVRKAEWILLAFLLYAAGLAAFLPVAPFIRDRVFLLNTAVVLVGILLIARDSVKPALATRIARDWLPLALVLLAYREIGWFALPHVSQQMESHLVVWDRLVLRDGGKAVIEAFGPLLPSILEISYTLVYALAPFAIAVLYLYGHRDRVDRFLFVFVVGVLLCYVQLPFWPSEPPRVVFFGQDVPAYDTIFRRLNLWMLGNYGIHTGVFPSAHVAGAFSAAFGMRQAMPDRKWVYRFLLVTATLIAIATVYGRYHYLADGVAGFLMAGLAALLQRSLNPSRTTRLTGCCPVSRDAEIYRPTG